MLITGPNGSGKEKMAEIIRENSRRQDKPFLTLNAGGLPDQLLEAELFGAEAGAFTGSTKLRIGRFEAAHGGTLFLDELGNMSMSGQMKLLRVLQTGEFERLGSNTTRNTVSTPRYQSIIEQYPIPDANRRSRSFTSNHASRVGMVVELWGAVSA